jgi:hypothetical protein
MPSMINYQAGDLVLVDVPFTVSGPENCNSDVSHPVGRTA